MALVRGNINHLNVLDARKLTFIPDHFSTMTLQGGVFEIALIDEWVYTNLDSRYAIIRSLKIDQSNKLVEGSTIGIEDAKELSILSLSCPFLNL